MHTGSLAGSLKGIRVLDAARVLAGPYAGQVLADLGADVIKVEQPGTGDETRGWGPPFDGPLSAYFLSCNRGKRSVALDLKQAAGRQVFLDLAARSDVLLENFRGDSAVALGLTPAELHAVNPRLIICSISGFGREGALAARPGYDFVVQGLSGMMASTGAVDGEPAKFGVAIADLATGLYAVVGVLAALHARAESGHGYKIELALLDCAVATMANVAQACLTSGKVPQRQGPAHGQIVPYQMFASQDGWLIVAVGNDGQWRRFAAVLGEPTWGDDPRYATNAARVERRQELVPLIAAHVARRSSADWEAALAAVGVPAGPVWNVDEMLRSDLAAARGLTMTVTRPDGTPVRLVRSPLLREQGAGVLAPPELGADTAAVLTEVLGLDAAAVARLMAQGVIA